MNNKVYVLSFLCLILTVSCGGYKELTVLHTSDTHSCIMPLSPNLADTLQAGRAGFERRIVMLGEEREKDRNLLLFDTGDFCQGSPYYTLFKGDVEAGLMNMMHYTAGTLGNHEFDYGLWNLGRVVEKLNYPIVCANYVFPDTSALARLVKPYVIIKRKGLKIGVFGLCPKLDGLVDKKNYLDTQFLDPIATAQLMVNELRRKHCDVIILLSHLGWNAGEQYSDQDVISHTSGINLVLGGHSHTYLKELGHVKNLDGQDIPVDHNGKNAIYVGKIKVTVARHPF